MTVPSAQKQAEAEAQRLRKQLLALQHAHRLQYECSEKWRTEAEELRAKLDRLVLAADAALVAHGMSKASAEALYETVAQCRR